MRYHKLGSMSNAIRNQMIFHCTHIFVYSLWTSEQSDYIFHEHIRLFNAVLTTPSMMYCKLQGCYFKGMRMKAELDNERNDVLQVCTLGFVRTCTYLRGYGGYVCMCVCGKYDGYLSTASRLTEPLV